MPDQSEPDVLAGRYRPVAVVGRGGQATVVKALDIRHDRTVALKIRPVFVDDAAAAAAQLAEAKALLSLPGHEGLAHARDDFFDGDRHVLVLDWVDGVDLAQILGSRGTPGLPASSVVRWLAQAAEAITVLHAHDIVHGDIKPANLVLNGRGRVVVVDLGSSSVPGHIGRGGTPGFRAPELSDGAVPTRANDVYGLAATAFALLTGAAPTGVLPSWQDIAPTQAAVLEAALRSGLTVDPARRPATPGEFVERLRAGWGDRVPTGVTTVLLTDVVGSTELWSRIPARMPSVLAGLQLAVDAAVEAHGGTRLGATIEGDSTVSAFPSALDAATAAVALQRSLAAPPGADELPPLRIGVATGEVVAVSGDIVGATVSRAARIRDLAGAGEILLSGSTAAVIAPALPADVELVSLGQHALRGIEARDEVHAVVTAGVAAPPDPSRCPYPGLAAFTVDDSPFFVGREALIEECLARFEATRFLGLIGGSGTGKSSLARAGLVPQLEGATVLTPGEHPLAALASALGEVPSGGVLFVDQLEEVVTLCRDRAEQEAFLDAVRCHEGGAVVALRADLYGELAGFGEFSDVLAANHVLVGPLSREELERTVAEPAARCGLGVEPGLVEVVVGELSNEPGTLPLLGHALRETWMRRDGRRLTVEGYRAAGGVDGAIARTAGALFDELDHDDRQAARELLLRMVELRDDGDDVRRWVALDEIRTVGTGRGLGVLERLASARLVTVEADRATLAHEALLSAWPTLRDWVRDERDGLVIRQQVRRASTIWVDGGRGDADLYRGRRLDATAEWRDTTHPDLTAAEAEFLDASAADAVRERDALAEQARHQARQNRRLRVALGIGAVLLVVAAATSLVAVGQRDRAERSVDQARAAEAVAEARRISTLALTVENLDQALLLAVEAVHLHDSNDTRSNLFAVLNRAPQAFAVVGPPAGDPLFGMATIDGGRSVAVARGTRVEFLEADTLRPTGRAIETRVEWGDAASTPDGERFAVLDMTIPRQTVRFLDTVAGGLTDVQLVVPEPFAWTNPTIAISDDGRWVAVSNHRFEEEDLPARRWIWDLAAPGAPPMEIDGGGDTPSVAFSADGVLVVGSDAPAAGVTAVDPASGDVVASIADARTPVAVGQGGLVGARQGDALALFDLASAQRRHVLTGASAPVAVAFSPDGSVVAVARQDGSIETWDTDTGQRVDALAGTNAPVELLEFAGDGSTLLSGSLGGSIVAWDLRGDRRVVRQISRPDPSIDGQGNVPSPDPSTDVQHSVPSPDGDSVVRFREGAGPDQWLVQDVATGQLREAVPTGFPVTTWLGWSPDGQHVVTVGDVPPVGRGAGTVRLWDPVTGELVAERALPVESPSGSIGWRPGGDTIFVGLMSNLGGVVELDADTLDVVGDPIRYDGHVVNVDLSPDGRLLAVAFLDFDPDRRVSTILVDHATREILATFEVDATYGLDFSPDGSLLAAGGGDGLVTLIDPQARRLVGAPFEHKFVNNVAWSPDGAQLLSTSLDGTIDLWDVARHSRIVQATPAGPGVPTVAWFRDGGATVVVAGEHGGLWSFPSDPDDWQRRACEIAGRNLTAAEWDELLPNHPDRQTCPDRARTRSAGREPVEHPGERGSNPFDANPNDEGPGP